MKRTHGAFALASLSLVWLVSATACSGGGNDTTTPADEAATTENTTPGDATPGDAAPGDAATSDPTPGDTISTTDPTTTSSPFETDAPTDGDDGSAPATDAPTDAPSDEPSTTDNGPELQRPTGDDSDTAAIAGAWDYSRETGEGTDVAAFEIGANGELTEYDFQNDAVGTGVDCAIVRRGTIASRGDDRYDVQDSSALPGSRSLDDVLITVDGGEIVFRYLGEDPDPQSGGGLTGVTERFAAADGEDLRASDECESDAN